MLNPDKVFIPLPDRIILSKLQELENEFVGGRKTINELRTEINEYYKKAVDEKTKKIILMEYDGLELRAKRQVT